MERSEQVLADQFASAAELRDTIGSVAREERAAGHSPVQMVLLLDEIINEAALERRIRPEVETDLVQWGIEAYFET